MQHLKYLALSLLSSLTLCTNTSAAQVRTSTAPIEIVGAVGFACLLNGGKGSLIGTSEKNAGKKLNANKETEKLKAKIASLAKRVSSLKRDIKRLKRKKRTAPIKEQIEKKNKEIYSLVKQSNALKGVITGIRECVNGVLKPAACNNGIVEAGEQCDDGNNLDGDCCSSTCTLDAVGSSCTSVDATSCGQCNSDGLCVSGGSGAECNDHDSCTTDDTCVAGNCIGTDVECPVRPHATSSCVLGVCSLECDDNRSDANNDSSDGCEHIISCPPNETQCGDVCVNLSTSTTNCGVCGNACAANELCVNGLCAVSCSPGTANCNGVTSDGCEVNLTSDTNNCGACGNACADQDACISGTCIG